MLFIFPHLKKLDICGSLGKFFIAQVSNSFTSILYWSTGSNIKDFCDLIFKGWVIIGTS